MKRQKQDVTLESKQKGTVPVWLMRDETGKDERREAEQRETFTRWLTQLPDTEQKIVNDSGVVPWERYGLEANSQSASYFRAVSLGFCAEKHLHVGLVGYRHDGEPFCTVEPVLAEDLVPYPYVDESGNVKRELIPPELIELEKVVIRKVNSGNDDSRTELVKEMVSGLAQEGELVEVQLFKRAQVEETGQERVTDPGELLGHGQGAGTESTPVPVPAGILQVMKDNGKNH